jgi:hypothetical protein
MTKGNSIALNNIIVQGKGNLVSVMDEEKVVLSIQNGRYYSLGQTGSKIWDIIEAPIAVNRLISTLVSEYDVEPAECEGQVISFLENLLVEGLIETGEDISF